MVQSFAPDWNHQLSLDRYVNLLHKICDIIHASPIVHGDYIRCVHGPFYNDSGAWLSHGHLCCYSCAPLCCALCVSHLPLTGRLARSVGGCCSDASIRSWVLVVIFNLFIMNAPLIVSCLFSQSRFPSCNSSPYVIYHYHPQPQQRKPGYPVAWCGGTPPLISLQCVCPPPPPPLQCGGPPSYP